MSHDLLCAQARYRSGRCMCELIAEVRADERERTLRETGGNVVLALEEKLAEAQARVERLEQVNCYLGPCWDGCINNDAHIAALDARDRLDAERDRLRAEVADLAAQLNGGGIR